MLYIIDKAQNSILGRVSPQKNLLVYLMKYSYIKQQRTSTYKVANTISYQSNPLRNQSTHLNKH